MGRPLLAGVELGGTKCICILGSGPDDIRAEVRVATSTPQATLAALRVVLDDWDAEFGPADALGIGSFGPLDLEPASASYGHVRASAKPGWRDVDVLGVLRGGRGIPVGFDTDVNGAALAEGRWGAAVGLRDYAYVTVGTGVGVGLVVNGDLVHGGGHTELGHVRVVRRAGDAWPGSCPYHRDCIEGLASGPAIATRTGTAASDLPPGDPVWDEVAHTLGQLLHLLVFTTGPRRILLGGGVALGRPELLERIRAELLASINGYVDLAASAGDLEWYVAPPGLGGRAGPLGALALAADAHARQARDVDGHA